MNDHSEAYLQALPSIVASSDAQGCTFFFNNSLFLLSRLERAPGWIIDTTPGALILHAAGDWCVALPTTTDRGLYAEALERTIAYRKPVLRVPGWFATRKDVLERHDVRYLWPDYVCDTAAMQTMAGSRLKGVRQRIARLERTGEFETILLGEEHQEAAGELARRWYKLRQPVLGTMFLFDENVWLFEHWGEVSRRLVGGFGVGTLHRGRLVAVNLSCALSERYWVCHTERYDPEVTPLYANQMAFRDACRRVDAAARPHVNDGPAEAPYRPGVDDIAAFKHRLASFELQSFRVLSRER